MVLPLQGHQNHVVPPSISILLGRILGVQQLYAVSARSTAHFGITPVSIHFVKMAAKVKWQSFTPTPPPPHPPANASIYFTIAGACKVLTYHSIYKMTTPVIKLLKKRLHKFLPDQIRRAK